MPDESAHSLSVGWITGGITLLNRPWDASISRLSEEIKALRDQPEPNGAYLNLEFHIPGHILSPEFTGVRTGVFRKKDRLLKVQIALPEDPGPDPRRILLDSARVGLLVAQEWAQRRKRHFDIDWFTTILDDVEK